MKEYIVGTEAGSELRILRNLIDCSYWRTLKTVKELLAPTIVRSKISALFYS